MLNIRWNNGGKELTETISTGLKTYKIRGPLARCPKVIPRLRIEIHIK